MVNSNISLGFWGRAHHKNMGYLPTLDTRLNAMPGRGLNPLETIEI